MSYRTFVRFSGMTCMIAGILRICTAVIPTPPNPPTISLEIVYAIIDLCILFGLLGVYSTHYDRAGLWGFAGFLLAVTGAASILGPDVTVGYLDIYILGAGLLTMGLSLFAIKIWNTDRLPRIVPLLWLGSTGFGMGGMMSGIDMAIHFAGVAFGLGFLIAGWHFWRQTKSWPIDVCPHNWPTETSKHRQ